MAEAAPRVKETVTSAAESKPPEGPSASRVGKKPTCIIVLGMAGSGKTTFVQVVTRHII